MPIHYLPWRRNDCFRTYKAGPGRARERNLITTRLRRSRYLVNPIHRTSPSGSSNDKNRLAGSKGCVSLSINAYLRTCFAMESFGESREPTKLPIRPPFIRRVRIRSDPRQGRLRLDELRPNSTRSQEEKLFAKYCDTGTESA